MGLSATLKAIINSICNSKCSSKLYIIAEMQLKLYIYDEKPVFKLSYLKNALFDCLLSTSILSKICNSKSIKFIGLIIYRWSGKRRCSCLYYATDLYKFEVRTECPEVRIELGRCYYKS